MQFISKSLFVFWVQLKTLYRKRIIKNFLSMIIVAALAIVAYSILGLGSDSEFFDVGLIATILGAQIAVLIAIMIFNFSIADKIETQIASYKTDDKKEESARWHFLNTMRELKEDSYLVFIGSFVIFILFLLNESSFLDNNANGQNIINMFVFAFLSNVTLAFMDCVLTFIKYFDLLQYRQKQMQ